MKKFTAVVFVLCLSVFAQQSGAATPAVTNIEGEIDQQNACETDSPLPNKKCIAGHKIYFQNPNRGVGSPATDNGYITQFTSNNCDLRYQIAHTNYGVVCIFLPVVQYLK